MIELNDNTIDDYIKQTIDSLEPEYFKTKIITEYNTLVNAQKALGETVEFIDCVRIYFFGTCFLYNIQNTLKKKFTKDNNKYADIIVTINNYLYKKQYTAEEKVLKYIPHSKAWLAQKLNTAPTEKVNILPEYHYENKLPDHLYIPKLNSEIVTTPKLLKITGLMNPEIAKMINDGQFTNVSSFKLENFSLKNQFIVRHRCRKYIDITETYTKLDFYKIDNLNKYYLLYIEIDNEDDIVVSALLLNAITHIDFQPGYLSTLRSELQKTTRKERYIYTFGIFKSFIESDIVSFIGGEHRCALIYDTQGKHIYYIDSDINKNNLLYNPAEVYKSYNSIDIAVRHALADVDDMTTYNVRIPILSLQRYDIIAEQYIVQSSYYRLNAGAPRFDWVGGYCGTYILLFFVIMILNPEVPIEQIFSFFTKISNDITDPEDTDKTGFVAHTFLLLLVRSFAKQIETHMTYSDTAIEFDKLDVSAYVNDRKVKVSTKTFPLPEGATPNYKKPFGNSKLEKQMWHPNNMSKVRAVYGDTNDKPLNAKVNQPLVTDKVYLNNIINMRVFLLLSDMFKRIDKIQTKLTPAQLQWQIENYGLGDSIYFIKY